MIDDILPNFTEFFKTFDKKKFMNDVKKDEAVPNNFVMFGEDNPMYGLKGNDHPASYWHKNERPEDWVIKNRERVLASWRDDDKRREDFSEKFKDTWSKNYEKMAEHARKNGNHGFKGKEVHNTLELEYKGNIYYGWRELKEATGVSKSLYQKYYLNGIDPEFRIGKNGPPPKEK